MKAKSPKMKLKNGQTYLISTKEGWVKAVCLRTSKYDVEFSTGKPGVRTFLNRTFLSETVKSL